MQKLVVHVLMVLDMIVKEPAITLSFPFEKKGDNPILQFSSSAKNILLMSVFIKQVFQGHTMSLRKLRELGLIYQSHHIKT